MDDVQRARWVCDQLLDAFDEIDTGLYTKWKNSRLLPIAFAWANQVHRFVRAALELHDRGFAHEAIVLQRQALEFTIRLHWLAQVGDPAVDTVTKEHQRSLRTRLADAVGGPLEIPLEYFDEVLSAEVDDVYAYGSFREACDSMNVVDSLYVLYRQLSAYVHPSWSSAQAYLEMSGEDSVVGVSLGPRLEWTGAPLMLAYLLIWSARAVDDLVEGRPRRRELQRLARSLGARPALPYVAKKRKAKPRQWV